MAVLYLTEIPVAGKLHKKANFDIRVRFTDGAQAIIEIEFSRKDDFKKRSQFIISSITDDQQIIFLELSKLDSLLTKPVETMTDAQIIYEMDQRQAEYSAINRALKEAAKKFKRAGVSFDVIAESTDIPLEEILAL